MNVRGDEISRRKSPQSLGPLWSVRVVAASDGAAPADGTLGHNCIAMSFHRHCRATEVGRHIRVAAIRALSGNNQRSNQIRVRSPSPMRDRR
jgi:hypothetical protein